MVFYKTAKLGAFNNGSNQISAQRQWLRRRDKDCAKGALKAFHKSIRECIVSEYYDRMYHLAIANLFAEPQSSIAEIKRQYPDEAVIYQAIYEYTTIDDVGKRSAVVGAIIAHLFEASRMQPAAEFMGHIIPASPSRGLEDVPTPQAAASSDQNFSNFLSDVAGWQNGDASRILPCAALARRPGLIDAIGERFAPSSDCDETMPRTPKFDRLFNMADLTANNCNGGGTIILDARGHEEALLTAIRADIPAEWEDYGRIYDSVERERSERRFREQHAADIRASEAEMTTYYISTFKLASGRARKQAREVVDVAISFQFTKCD